MTERLTDEALAEYWRAQATRADSMGAVLAADRMRQTADALSRRATPADDLRAEAYESAALLAEAQKHEGRGNSYFNDGWYACAVMISDSIREEAAALSKPAPAPQPAADLRAALQGMVDMWASVCRAQGHDPAHMAQYEGALAVLSQNGGAA